MFRHALNFAVNRIESLNSAISEILDASQDRTQWIPVNVDIEPSNVHLRDDLTGDMVMERRVR